MLIKSEVGIGYVAILMLLAILSAMGLAFMSKVGVMSSMTLSRRTSMQTRYLAESAANHAVWRLLNEPGFNPAPDTYYMHAFANGRYGYKVRKPTETTFATVATVGAIEDSVVNQSYVQYIIPSNILTAYGSSTNPLPKYRRLIGAQWTDPGDLLIGGADTIYWLELEGCPIRKELVAGIIDGVDEVKVAVYNGRTWGNAELFGHGDRTDKCFDIAYESQSGDALVVGRDGINTTLYYNIWDGTSWAFANPQTAINLESGYLRLVTMASCPGNDDILIATVSSHNALQLFGWNGTAFTDLGVIEGNTATANHGVAQIVYERQSGDALILWAARGTIRYRVWNGAVLGPENTVAGFDADVFVLRAAADPAGDTIVVAGIDKFYDITVAVWDGDAWIDAREVETACGSRAVQALDVAWEASGEDALVVWQPSSSAFVRSLAWKKGTALADSTVEPGPDFQNPWLVRLHPISQSEKIILLVEDYSNDLRYSLWDGERFKGDPAILLESDIPVLNDMAFDLAEADVPRSGGTGSFTNLPPTVDAGPDQTIYAPSNEANLDGTVSDDGLPNPPAAVTTMWSVASGPGTVIFDDSSLVDTVARFSDAGDYVLRLTADDSDLTAFDEITLTVEPPCDAGYAPDTKIADFSTSAYGSVSLEGVGYLPEGKSFNLIPVPAGGALISVDMGDKFYLTNLAGTLLTSLAMPGGSPTGVSLVQSGTWADHLAVSDKFSDEIKYFDLSGNYVGSFSTNVSANFNASTPEDVAFIGKTASGTYDDHLAIPDPGRNKVFLVDQNGSWVSSIDLTGIMSNVKGAVHVPATDKLLLVGLGGQAFIVDFLGNLLNQYDTAAFGADSPGTVTINPLTCDHLLGDDTPDLIVTVNRMGSGDANPPMPNPMTWASPPTASSPQSITMTATPASDPSGVEYYFECTAGGGNDSGWQSSSIYVDGGLSPETLYTYRVKARDKSASQNETAWSSEASATTPSSEFYVYDIAMSFRVQGNTYFGQATVWIKGADGANISGAVVSGDWSGAVSGSSSGNTGIDGKVVLESAGKNFGGTFTFTVTNVTKLDYTYNSGLNVETSDFIAAP